MKAVIWLGKAAEQGHIEAQSYLGVLYCAGEGGVPMDLMQGCMWMNLAALKGDGKSIRDLKIVVELMTSSQIIQAEKLAHEWSTKHK